MLGPRSWWHSFVLLAGCGLLATAGLHTQTRTVAAEEAPTEESSSPVEGILVMRTGAVVSGKIERSDNLYKVISPHGQMHVPAELVKLRCADLEEAYSKLRETAKSHQSASAQITLARWCLTNHLDNQARQELHEALLLEPDREDAKRLLRDVEDSIKSSQKNAPAGQPASPVRGARPATSADDETVTLGGLSREQALQFTRRIQPLLVNSCASAGCHSRDAQNGFRLQNVSPGTNSNRNATERNLSQILEHVDVKKPRSSSLLTVPGRHHGRNGRPVFAGQRGDDKLAELENWVVAVARDEMQRNQHDARRKSGAERAATSSQDESRPAAGVRTAAAIGKQVPNADPFAQTASDATNSQRPLPPASEDPFSPEAFNRGNARRAGR
jgi:hypothetical protein